MSPLQQVKHEIVVHTMLAKDALHIYVALVILFTSCALFRWRLTQFKPWLLVMLVAVIGEIWDIRDSIKSNDPLHFEENIKDIWNTMLVPTILLLAARYTKVFRPRDEAPTEAADEEEEPEA